MAQSDTATADDPVRIENDAEATDCVTNAFGVTELRRLCSNVGVSRERGDSKRDTARRLVEQDPALAARLLENDREVPHDASAFRAAREAGEGRISLDEAFVRARHKTMATRLDQLQRAIDQRFFEAEVDWEYDDGPLTSIVIKTREDADMSPLLDSRAHVLLTARGAPRHLSVSTSGRRDMLDRGHPRRSWRVFLRTVEGFYAPSE